jgi:hypothetical protein
MVQAVVLDGEFLDLLPPFDDGDVPAEVDVGGGDRLILTSGKVGSRMATRQHQEGIERSKFLCVNFSTHEDYVGFPPSPCLPHLPF